MPYVVKTTRPSGECATAMSGPTCWNRDCPPCQTPDLEVLSNVAVATLDEARSKVIVQIDLHGHARDRRVAHATADDLVTEQGGKVSLPDGGEIEVAALTLVDLAYRAGMRDRWLVAASATEVCDAYNARAEG